MQRPLFLCFYTSSCVKGEEARGARKSVSGDTGELAKSGIKEQGTGSKDQRRKITRIEGNTQTASNRCLVRGCKAIRYVVGDFLGEK